MTKRRLIMSTTQNMDLITTYKDKLHEAMKLFKSMSSSSKTEAIQHWNLVANQFQLQIEKVADEWIGEDAFNSAKASPHAGNTFTSGINESLWLQNNIPSYDQQPCLYETPFDNQTNDASGSVDDFSSLEVPVKCEPQESTPICTYSSGIVADFPTDPPLLSQTNSSFIEPNSSQSVWKQPEVYSQTPISTSINAELGTNFPRLEVSEDLTLATSLAPSEVTQSQVEAHDGKIEPTQTTLLEQNIEIAAEHVLQSEQMYPDEVCELADTNQAVSVPFHGSSPNNQVYLLQDVQFAQISKNNVESFSSSTNFYSVIDQQVEVIPSDFDHSCQTETIDNETSCLICGKSGFSTKSNLRRHVTSHKRRFPCEICSKSYAEKKSLEVHTRTHTGERPYKCEMCGKEFIQETVLKNHITTHTGDKKFACMLCPKMFRQQAQLTTHILRHQGTKRISCTECDARFITKDELVKHLRKHTGERPFACQNCGKKYKRKGDLKRHLGTRGQAVGINSNSCTGHCSDNKFSTSNNSNVIINKY